MRRSTTAMLSSLAFSGACAAPVIDLDTLSPTNLSLGGAQVNCCGATGNTVAASIEAAVAGQLTRVDLQIAALLPGHQLTMYLAPTDAAGVPVTDLSAAYASFTVTVPVWPVFANYPITSIDVLSAGLFLDAGEDYAVILTNTLNVAGDNIVGWAQSLAPSARLQPYDRSGGTLAWDPCILGLACSVDMALRTFVDPELQPAAVPEPATLLLAGLGFGLAGLVSRWRPRGRGAGARRGITRVAGNRAGGWRGSVRSLGPGLLAGCGCIATAYAAPVLNATAELKDPGNRVGGSQLDTDSYGPGKPFAIAEVSGTDGSVARGGGWFPGGVLSAYTRSNTQDVQTIGQSVIVDTLTFRLPAGMSEAVLTFTLAPTARTATHIGSTDFSISLGTSGGTCVIPGSCATGNGSAPITATLRVVDGQQVLLQARSGAMAVTTDSSKDSIYGVQSLLALDAPSGVTFTSESGITFGAPPPPGSGPGDPILPIPGTGDIDVNDCVFYRVRCYVDPLVAVGYEYAMGAGLSNIESFLLPTDIGDGHYELFLFDPVADAYATEGIPVLGGTVYDFISDFGIAGGVSRFVIRGIETDAAIDPNDFTRFVTGLTFVGSNLDGYLTMTPITVDVGGNAVPGPSTIALAGLALLALAGRRRAARAASLD